MLLGEPLALSSADVQDGALSAIADGWINEEFIP